MDIVRDYNLKDLNTFGIVAHAKYFVVLEHETDITALFATPEFKDNKRLFLGGGSNVLFTGDFDGIVILNKLKGVEIIHDDGEQVSIKIMGGEIWHDVVIFAVEHNLWGIENLSLIPGTAGATPIQNIGAYGVELKDTLESAEGYDVETGVKKIFSREECKLGYRDSIFKNDLKGKYFITSLTLTLNKIPQPNISYKILQNYLQEHNIEENLKNISDAVSAIRKSKLPDPKEIGNAGSFFKNTFVDAETLKKLQLQYPDISYFEEDGIIKIPSGWLIEQCGFKGMRFGTVGVHAKQALVLVNHGGATGGEVRDLAYKIIDTVKEKFGLTLEPEVNII